VNQFLVDRVVFPLHELLKRSSNRQQLRELERTQWLAPEALRELQFARLRRHLEHAYNRTTYYRRLLDEHECPPRRIQSFADFARIPPLTRDTLRTRFDELRVIGVREGGPIQRVASGGSTGEPVVILQDIRIGSGASIRWRAHGWFGLTPFAREVVLWASPLELSQQDRLRSGRDWFINSKLLSAFDLGEAGLARCAEVMTSFRPERIFGYASAIYILARYLDAVGWRPARRIRAVFTTAEPLFDFQRETITRVFDCPAAIEYGARDAGAVANECLDGGLHIPAEMVHVEVEDTGTDGLGEILVTDLMAQPMPLIRYRTGDLGELDARLCVCGRSLPLLKRVEGRRTDFLVSPGGRVQHALSVIYILREVERVKEFQVVQETVHRVRVLVVPRPGWTEVETAAVTTKVHKLLGHDVDVSLELVDAIPRTASGKFRYVISQIAEAYLDRLLGQAGGPRG
jgi:phenylacetate-CoA ligase